MSSFMSIIGNISSILGLLTLGYGVVIWRWDNRKIAIFAVCEQKRILLTYLPAKLTTRSEVSGIVAQCASGPDRLDLSNFNFDFYKIQDVVEIPLNQSDFDRITGMSSQ